MFKNYKWNFTTFIFHLLFFPTILALYLHLLYQCVRVEISYSLVYHMSKYLVYQERYRQLSGNYPKSHCDLLTLSLKQFFAGDEDECSQNPSGCMNGACCTNTICLDTCDCLRKGYTDSLQLTSMNATLIPVRTVVFVSTTLVHSLVTAQIQAIRDQHVQVCVCISFFKFILLLFDYHLHFIHPILQCVG